MPVTIPQVEAAAPESLTRSGAELGRLASTLNDRLHQQRTALSRLQSAWQGTASDAAVAKAAPTLEQMQRLHQSLTRLQAGLADGGALLTRTRAEVLRASGQLQQQGWQVSPDGDVSIRPGGPLDKFAQLSPANAMKAQQLAARNSATMKTLLASFDTADRQVGENLRNAVSALGGPVPGIGFGGPFPAAPPPAPGPQIPDGKPPEEVKKWWESLSQADRDRLVREQPLKLGNLDGLPVADRSKANIEVMNRDIARVENATEAIPHDQMVRYYNALKVREGLAAQQAKTKAETFLYVYEPEVFNGQGRAAVAIGNPDAADNTAVVVPGTGNSVSSGWLSSDDPARVFDQTAKADLTRATAVVAWMGYDAPDSLLDPQVGQPGNARQGGELMAADVNALEVTNKADSHVTVMGHSYGATAAADAAAGFGMRADDIVLIGSPGTDLAQSAADFHLPDNGNVFVGAASTDPVTHLGGAQAMLPGTDVTVALGDDPAAEDFGSTRFKAEVPGLTAPWSDHSGYLVQGSESLYSIATIASGHGEMLEELGMTASHRTTVGIPGLPGPEVDPELFRPGTSGHTY